MNRFANLVALLIPAAFAGGASAVTVESGATLHVAQDRSAAGTYEALTNLLITNPDSPEAALARNALIRGIDRSDPSAENAVIVSQNGNCESINCYSL